MSSRVVQPEARRVRWADHDRALVVTVAAVVLAVAAVGLRVLGVPTVDIHPPFHYWGIMDPGCGGTRAMFFLLSGDLTAAAQYNPVVFPLAGAVLLVLLRGVVGVVTGRWWDVRLQRGTRRLLIAVLAVAFVTLGVRQQLHAELLMQTWVPR